MIREQPSYKSFSESNHPASALQFGNDYFVNKTNEKTPMGSSFAELFFPR